MLALLCCVTPARAEDRDAEQLFRKMEEKLGSAKAMNVTYEFQKGKSPGRMSGTILLAEGNRLRWEERPKGESLADEIILIADGKSAALLGLENELAKPVAVPANFRKVVVQTLARQGVCAFKEVVGVARQGSAPEPGALPAGDFALGGKEKIGGREAHVISYRMGIRGVAEWPVRLWLDTQTGLPLKRQTGDGEEALTETYSEFTLEPKLDGDAFRLREILDRQSQAQGVLRELEKRIRTAKALKVVLEAEEWEGKDRKRLKGFVVLAEGNRVRIELTRTGGEKAETMKLVSDGKHGVGEGEPFDTEGKAKPVPATLNEELAALLARAGVLGLLSPGGAGPDGKFDIDLEVPLLGVSLGSRQKVDGREAEVLRVKTRMHLVRQSVTVWIDVKTRLPLKRVGTWEGGQLTETYTEFKLDPRLDAAFFALPKR
jgi:outer membrane lipoprotein-sorting protein